MSIYSDKLTHVKVVINCPYSVAQFCTSKDRLAHILGAPFIDDVMSYNLLTTSIAPPRMLIGVWDLSWRQHLFWQVNTVQIIINCPFSIAQFCTNKDMLLTLQGAPSIDDVKSYNLLTTIFIDERLVKARSIWTNKLLLIWCKVVQPFTSSKMG